MNRELFRYKISETEKHLWEVEGLEKGEYDAQAVQYDRLISNGLYNRIMWGNSPKDYAAFCNLGLERGSAGICADIGCGTLSFTYKAYVEHRSKNLFLCDLSYEMLKIGKNRLESLSPNLSGIALLRSNALDLPFKAGTVNTVFSFGLFHIFSDPGALIREITRILAPDGQLFLTSLCTDRKLSARYLKFLHKKGHLASVLHSIEIAQIIEENGINITEQTTNGGMSYVLGIKASTA